MNFLKKGTSVNRSDKLRQKRQPAAQTRSDAASSSLSKSAVVTRRSESTGISRQAAGTPPRRKVVYAVGANGVETRIPALPIIRFSWQWISGILTVLLLMFIIILINSPMFLVNGFEVNGLTTYSSTDFEPLLKGRQTSIFLVNTGEILDSILVTFPELVGSQVDISMPNRIVITAAERKPVILWQSDSGDFWIDAEGVILAPRGEAHDLLTISSPVTPPLLVERKAPGNAVEYAMMVMERKTRPVNPAERADHIHPDVLQTALVMYAHIPEGAALIYDPVSGMGWEDPGGWDVYFGNDLSNVELKQVMYQAVLDRLENEGVSPVMISVEHVDAPYYRTE